MGVAIVVGTKKGGVVVRSDERRERFEVGDMIFRGWEVTAATRDAGGRTYLGVTNEVYGPAIAISDDLESWRTIDKSPRYAPDLPGNPEHQQIAGLQPGPRRVDSIWRLAAAGDVVYAGVSEAGLFRSEDRGESWQPVSGFNEQEGRDEWIPGFGGLCTHSLLVDQQNPERLMVGVSSAGAFRSTDGGATWSPSNDGVSKSEAFCVHALAADPDDADRIFRQDHRGVYRSLDFGGSWQLIENGLPECTVQGGHIASFGFPIVVDPHTKAVYVIPLDGDEFHVPHDGALAVYRSEDAGDSWQPLREGLQQTNVWTSVLRGSFSVDGLDPCGLAFGTSSGTLHLSRDRGDSWTTLPATFPRIVAVAAFEV